MKAVVILVDGMRPDALAQIPQAQALMKEASYCLDARTVMPSVTLPCHMSLFHSVDPDRHGTTTNIYAPQVRPVKGLCEVLAAAGKTSAFFYNWAELCDLARPGSLTYSYFCKGSDLGYEETNNLVTGEAIRHLKAYEPDFTFLYLGYVDMEGHRHGWMSEPYMHAIENSWENIARLMQSLPEEYTVIVTADHGGHDRIHGTDMPEDMTIPLMLKGTGFEAGKEIQGAGIKDIAPTVAALLGVGPDPEWEGKSLLEPTAE